MWYFIAGGILAVILLLSLLMVLRSDYERKQLRVTRYTVQSERLPEGFHGKKIVFLSDLHDHRLGPGNEKLISVIAACQADYVMIGGDMMTVKSFGTDDFSALSEVLSGLPKGVPVFYANGNHELRMRDRSGEYPGWYEKFRELLAGYPVTYLDDTTCEIRSGEDTMYVSGMNFEPYYYKKGRRKMAPGCVTAHLGERRDPFHIVLAHSPLYLSSFREYGADLVLSGHFHGGTIYIPVLGGLMSPQFNFFSRYCRGMLKKGSTTEIVSGGLGTHSVNLRVNNIPEILLITLERKESR